jgi:hypothetical protein
MLGACAVGKKRQRKEKSLGLCQVTGLLLEIRLKRWSEGLLLLS